ncbi:hypothetical protein BK647_18035 [Pseudomonas protegens]|uniref:hypothetical protein n=1 Tax=Pseudomonas protegens TaxID=380021 RepID=UPI000F46A5C8|nr:hypothetical protein [Pseudomonas protegens]ROM40650.1 hypothetical protein BK647_18035 [Pseudomonas protegens]
MDKTEQDKLIHHQRLEAFRDFARGRINLDLLQNDGERFTHSTVQLIFEAFLAEAAGVQVIGQQLYAGIKEGSRYHSQIEFGKSCGWPHPFPIKFEPCPDGYVVRGGVGGRYRMEDVELYVLQNGSKVRVA